MSKRINDGVNLGEAFDGFLHQVHHLNAEGKRAVGLTLVASIKQELSTPGRGKYRRSEVKRLGKKSKRGRGAARSQLGTRASAPGDPPAPDSGALRNSVQYHEQNSKQVVGTDQPQAAALEFGTKSAGKNHNVVILPRPYMRPGFEKVRDKLGGAVAGVLKVKPV